MTGDAGEYIALNLKPILQKCKQKCTSWCKLPLSVTGRASLIKMVWVPQLLYVLHKAPVWLPKYWFDYIDSQYKELIWKYRVARVKLTTLQYPKDEGGLAFPHSLTYFLASQLQHLTGWDLPLVADPSRTLLIRSLLEFSILSQMEMGLPELPSQCPTIQLLLKFRVELKHRLCLTGFLPCTPIWRNRSYKELVTLENDSTWITAKVKYLS